MRDDTPLGALRFVTVSEVASALRVSKMTVYRMVKDGTLDAVRFGRSFRIREDSVESYLRAAVVTAGSTT
jgi:excisionase family DNA binding protein